MDWLNLEKLVPVSGPWPTDPLLIDGQRGWAVHGSLGRLMPGCGDFIVTVTSPLRGWVERQFAHVELWESSGRTPPTLSGCSDC